MEQLFQYAQGEEKDKMLVGLGIASCRYIEKTRNQKISKFFSKHFSNPHFQMVLQTIIDNENTKREAMRNEKMAFKVAFGRFQFDPENVLNFLKQTSGHFDEKNLILMKEVSTFFQEETTSNELEKYLRWYEKRLLMKVLPQKPKTQSKKM